MGRVEQLIAHLEILCKRGAINIGQAPSYELLQHLEHRFLYDYRRAKGFADDPENRFKCLCL